MPNSPLMLVVQPPLDEKDLDQMRDDYAYYKHELDQDSTALDGSDIDDLLKIVWKLLEQVDFRQKKIAAKNLKVMCKILDHNKLN
jgi:hypothetical protein